MCIWSAADIGAKPRTPEWMVDNQIALYTVGHKNVPRY